MHNLGYSERYACDLVGLNRSTYYKMRHRPPSDREIRQIVLADLIYEIHQRSRGTYGILRIRAALEIEHGLIVNTKLVKKLMKRLGIQGLPGPRKGRPNLVNVATCEDLVQRHFVASRPHELWLTDITEHSTSDGKLYCCCVLDMFTRTAVGWAMGRRATSDMVNAALLMAHEHRDDERTVIHSDHGSQFTSWAFSENVRRLGLVSSMGTVGDAYDNAPMESFWGTVQIELLNRQRWRSTVELSVALVDFFENFYNATRRHSSLGYLTPNEFSDLYSNKTRAEMLQLVVH
jgi:transposase InsO family protein